MVEIAATAIPDVRIVASRRFVDARGFFTETYSRRDFAAAGIDVEFVQENSSLSVAKGTVRGLHFQAPPHAQAKLVRVAGGAVLDVAVDLRKRSPTYGRHVAVELSADNGLQLFIPAGFAHGFCTLAPDTTVIYRTSAYYAPRHEHGIAFDDPALNIAWPVKAGEAVLSVKDRELAKFADVDSPFE